MEDLATYESLYQLVNKMRTAHWEAIKYRSRQAADKEKALGYKIDSILREENKKRNELQKQIR